MSERLDMQRLLSLSGNDLQVIKSYRCTKGDDKGRILLLDSAIGNKHSQIAEVLIEESIGVDKVSSTGATLLVLVVRNNLPYVAALLLDYGNAKIDAQDHEGRTKFIFDRCIV